MAILIVALIVLGLFFLVVSRSKKEKKGNWVQFVARGREAGFSFKEIEMLRRLAAECDLEYPNSLFESQNQLDKCIRSMVRSIKMSGESEERGTQDFLSKLYDYRQKVEINKPHVSYSITNSRQISENQTLRVLVVGTGVFKSQVIKNSSQYINISRPAGAKNAAMSWIGTKISVYFWREEDAGYVFDSEVVDEVFSLGFPSLKITHGDSLFRTQKRRSIRTKMHKAAFLYLVPTTEPSHKIEIDPGLKCFIEDISDTGCAVTVGGRADAGLRVKVQFALDNTAICMTGTVRSINYRDEANRSVLHIEAEPLPNEIRNHILGEVFGMLPDDDEDELPFRVLDGEKASPNADDGASNDVPANDVLPNDILADGVPLAGLGGVVSEEVTVGIGAPRSLTQETDGF